MSQLIRATNQCLLVYYDTYSEYYSQIFTPFLITAASVLISRLGLADVTGEKLIYVITVEKFTFECEQKFVLQLRNITLNIFSRRFQAPLVTLNIQLISFFVFDRILENSYSENDFYRFCLILILFLQDIFKPLLVPAASINIYFLAGKENLEQF